MIKNRFEEAKKNRALDQFDKKKVKEMKKPKNIRTAMQIYNVACNACKALMLKDPARPMSDYCEECQRKFTEVWNK